MLKPLPSGIEFFEEFSQKGYYYVDKTLFIKNLIDNMGKVNLFTRPRRFGKTLTLDMSLIPVGELTIVGSRCGPFEPALRLLDEQKVHFPEVELYDLKDYEAAFASKAFKAGFRI